MVCEEICPVWGAQLRATPASGVLTFFRCLRRQACEGLWSNMLDYVRPSYSQAALHEPQSLFCVPCSFIASLDAASVDVPRLANEL